ncbi:rna polymerase ii c-terminal domain phosphatase-like 4 [Quercus suber]|uniref:protein-serine/threonine phosphatase n=1 Tax=Quercus suber TaxID=58331 RepID=A0AAW0J822_QUESU
MMVKLRPFVHTFLKAASTMFKIYMCTMCTRSYALQVAKILDPENTLDLVLGEERMVLILDDTKSVWSKHPFNLIHIKRYRYFDSDPDSWNADEVESTGPLIAILQRLNAGLQYRDVRYIFARHDVLRGYTLFVKHIFIPDFRPENLRL